MTKSVIPKKDRERMAGDPFYKTCALRGIHNHICAGRITWEHALTFGGKKIQRPWAIIPLCAKGHGVDEWQDAGTMNKSMNRWVAVNLATNEELEEVSKAVDYKFERDRLNRRYGKYVKPVFERGLGIIYPPDLF